VHRENDRAFVPRFLAFRIISMTGAEILIGMVKSAASLA
jgi:hypothetical protein